MSVTAVGMNYSRVIVYSGDLELRTAVTAADSHDPLNPPLSQPRPDPQEEKPAVLHVCELLLLGLLRACCAVLCVSAVCCDVFFDSGPPKVGGGGP